MAIHCASRNALNLVQTNRMSEEFQREFIDQSIHRIDENTKRLRACLDELDESEMWKRPNENSNSIGNLILHLCGNIRQYAISSLGNIPDVRERDKEFSADGGYLKHELLERLISTIDQAKDTMRTVSAAELLRKRRVQGYTYSGIGIIVHITEHYSYHTGQIIFWTKLLKNKDLGFYSGVDLNAKNDSV
jgi:uncharacterized damage-inducible protein DinB